MIAPAERHGPLIDFAFFGEEARFHHVGLAVDSIKALSPASKPVTDEIQRVSVAFVRLNGAVVELIEPWGERSPILRSLQQGVKLLHLCYEVPELETTLAHCRCAGFHRLGPPVPAAPFDHRRIAWVFSRQYGLFELLERGGGSTD